MFTITKTRGYTRRKTAFGARPQLNTYAMFSMTTRRARDAGEIMDPATICNQMTKLQRRHAPSTA